MCFAHGLKAVPESFMVFLFVGYETAEETQDTKK